MERLLKFVTRYILIGLFVSVLIIAAAHVLEVTALPAPIKPVDAFIQTNGILRATSFFLHDNLLWDYASEPVIEDDSQEALLPQASSRVDPPAPLFPPSTPPARTVRPPVHSPPPAAAKGPPWWGVVIASTAKAYSSSGKFLFRPDPGALFKITDIRKTKSGELAQGYAVTGGHANSKVFVPVGDLTIRAGNLTDLSTTVRDLCVREGRLLGAIDEFERESKKALRQDNPHTPEYARTKSAYVAYWKKVKALQAQRDESEGADHVRISDELRALKGDDIHLGQAYELAKKNYEEWNRTHPVASIEPSELATLEQELAEVRTRLDEMDATVP